MNDFRVGDRVRVNAGVFDVHGDWSGKTGRIKSRHEEGAGGWLIEVDGTYGLTYFGDDELEPETPATPTITVPDTAETVELVARALAEHEAGRDPLDALWMNAAGAILEALREASAGPGEGGA